jgi:hypothetical protein
VRSGALPHRKRDLESLAVRLQFGPQQSRIHQLIDEYKAKLPPIPEQQEVDHLLRLVLNRIDTRNFTAQVIGPPSVHCNETVKGGRQDVILMSPAPDQDLAPMVESAKTDCEALERSISVFLWGVHAFDRKEGAGESWQKWLESARDPQLIEATGWHPSSHGPVLVAAVCARDHWMEMNKEAQNWCVEQLISAVIREAYRGELFLERSADLHDGAKQAALTLALVHSYHLQAEERKAVREVLTIAITHPIGIVVLIAAHGIGAYLGQTDWLFVSHCLRRLAFQAKREADLEEGERPKPFVDRIPSRQLGLAALQFARELPLDDTPCTSEDLAALDISTWHGRRIIRPVMTMLMSCPNQPLSRELFAAVATRLADGWQQDRRNSDDRRDYHFEGDCNHYLARFLIRLDPGAAIAVVRPIVDAVAECPREVSYFTRELVIAADQWDGDHGAFWAVWQQLADAAVHAPWTSDLGDRYPRDSGLLHAIFLGIQWKEGVRHWRVLEGNAGRIDGFFRRLPRVAIVFGAYSRFLNSIGERSLPAAFVHLSQHLQGAIPAMALGGTNTLYYLENALRGWVYGRPAALKQDKTVRDAVLHLLDQMVEAGSSVAYRMRDDFVTPRS